MKELNMRRERLAKGDTWTQKYVGQQVGVSKVAIHDIETGRRKPSYDVLVKLEKLFHKSHRYLFSQVEEPQQPDYTKPPKLNKGGIAEAKALSEAAKKFDVTDVVLDVADNGKIDDPANREAALGVYDALGAVLV